MICLESETFFHCLIRSDPVLNSPDRPLLIENNVLMGCFIITFMIKKVMRKILTTVLFISLSFLVSGQTIISMEKKNGIFVMPCS